MIESALRAMLASLEACRSSLHSCLHFWTWLVVIGVASEIGFVIWEHWEDLHDFRQGFIHPPEKPNVWLLVLGLLGVGLVTAGVAGELEIDAKLGVVESNIGKVNDELYALLSQEAEDAKDSALIAKASAKAAGISAGNAQQKAVGAAEQAGAAKNDAAKAQESSVIAHNMAMKERFEREQMEQLSLPRKLNISRWFEYCRQLEKYSGTKFLIVTLTDTEPNRLRKRIEELLKASGWVEEEPTIRYSDADELMIPDGIWIEANGPIVTVPPKPLTAAMDALRNVLTNSIISAQRSFLNPRLPPAKLPPDTIRIVIGLRPDPYEIKRWEIESERERR